MEVFWDSADAGNWNILTNYKLTNSERVYLVFFISHSNNLLWHVNMSITWKDKFSFEILSDSAFSNTMTYILEKNVDRAERFGDFWKLQEWAKQSSILGSRKWWQFSGHFESCRGDKAGMSQTIGHWHLWLRLTFLSHSFWKNTICPLAK